MKPGATNNPVASISRRPDAPVFIWEPEGGG